MARTTKQKEMNAKEWLEGGVWFDERGGYIWVKGNDGSKMVADKLSLTRIRGWGSISNQAKNYEDAVALQNEIGRFIADAINEKLERNRLTQKK